MLSMTHAQEIKKQPEIHWFVPAMATNLSHPSEADCASRESHAAAITTPPRISKRIPDRRTYKLRPALKKVSIAPTVLPLNFASFLEIVDIYYLCISIKAQIYQ